MIALILQIAGFALFVVLAAFKQPALYTGLAFGVHVVGDIIFVIENGVPSDMSFLDSFESAVKIKPWLQFVGYMVAFGGLILTSKHGNLGPIVSYVGLGMSFAGFLYNKIYP